MGHSQMLQTWQNSHQNLDRKATNVNFVLTVTDAALDYAETRYVKLIGDTMTGTLQVPTLVSTGGVNAAETIKGRDFEVESSQNVKKNIKPFEGSALDIIDNIDIVSFHYKSAEDPVPQIGFIAENTTELLAGKDHNMMRINTAIGLLIKAVQELREEVKQLKSNS